MKYLKQNTITDNAFRPKPDFYKNASGAKKVGVLDNRITIKNNIPKIVAILSGSKIIEGTGEFKVEYPTKLNKPPLLFGIIKTASGTNYKTIKTTQIPYQGLLFYTYYGVTTASVTESYLKFSYNAISKTRLTYKVRLMDLSV